MVVVIRMTHTLINKVVSLFAYISYFNDQYLHYPEIPLLLSQTTLKNLTTILLKYTKSWYTFCYHKPSQSPAFQNNNHFKDVHVQSVSKTRILGMVVAKILVKVSLLSVFKKR